MFLIEITGCSVVFVNWCFLINGNNFCSASLLKAANRLFCPDLDLIVEIGRFLEILGPTEISNLH